MNVPEHLTIKHSGPDRYEVECTVCRYSMDAGRTFGPMSGADLAATFVVQHATHSNTGKPTGLVRGKPSPAARQVLR